MDLLQRISDPVISAYPSDGKHNWQAIVTFWDNGTWDDVQSHVRNKKQFRKAVAKFLEENFGTPGRDWGVRYDNFGMVHVYFANKADAFSAYLMLS